MCPTPMAKAPEPALGYAPIPKERYTSREFAQLEWERMWTRSGCSRAARPMRRTRATTSPSRSAPSRCSWCASATARSPRATTSACTAATGCASRAAATPSASRCLFHGWQYDLDGTLLARARSASAFRRAAGRAALDLRPVRCETWAGFVFVSLDPDAAPLRDYLGVDPRAPRSVPLRASGRSPSTPRSRSTATGRRRSTPSTRPTTSPPRTPGRSSSATTSTRSTTATSATRA